jgi:hypothetical protein
MLSSIIQLGPDFRLKSEEGCLACPIILLVANRRELQKVSTCNNLGSVRVKL